MGLIAKVYFALCWFDLSIGSATVFALLCIDIIIIIITD